MNLNLRELTQKETSIGLTGRVEMADAVKGRNDLRLKEPVEASLTAHSDSGTAIVTGTLTAELEFVCSKCLRTAEERVNVPVTEMFTLQRGVAELDEDIHLVQEEVIDLAPYLQEAFVVHLPIAAVCSDECKGLCPACGQDLNAEPCGCVHEKIDPRLAGLKDFFNKS
ncbi:DUF177 domain-containing protein [Paenibacillus sp. TRM 82003]|nr:DUF177 domain-containing protein [Paenibacillus sp. TRM 82003]